MKIIKLFNLLYTILISLLLYIILKPILLIFKKTLSKATYKLINYKLINMINYLYFFDMINQKKFNIEKSDIRNYRDNYDKKGLELYLKILPKKELFENKSILDLGCGVGGKCLEIAIKYNPKKILGIDLSNRNYKICKRTYK